MGWGKSGFNQEVRARFILVLREYIWNTPAVSLALPSFQPLTIPAPWGFLRVRWSIPLFEWFHPG